MSHSETSTHTKDEESSHYEDYEEFEKSLVSSTPYTTSRKTITVNSETPNSTFSVKENSPTREASTEWEKWILKKASEQSFVEAEKKKKEKELRKKDKETKRAHKEKLKQQDAVIEDWIRKKTQQEIEKRKKEKERLVEQENAKKAKKEEILNKSVVVVKEWKKKKLEILKKSEVEKTAEAEKLERQKEEMREKSVQKYEEWLKNHKPPPTPPRTKPKTLSDFYGPGICGSPGYKNPQPWNGETEVKHEQSKIYYTTFG